MLCVPAEIRKSEIHGSGVFAAADIARGAVVWQFSPGLDKVVSLYAIEGAEPRARHYALARGFINPIHPDAVVLCIDEAQFMNFPRRGEMANTKLGGIIDQQYLLLARVDIPAGTELTVPPESDADYDRKMAEHEAGTESRGDVQVHR